MDKFKPKLTTDDCYTPESVYEAVRAFVFEHYDLAEDTQVVRPFWPGADYKSVIYPENCVVIDNPPFSLISQIEKFYLKNGIRFFMFAPALTIFKPYKGMHYVLTDSTITYENGAKVNTAFVTDLGENLVEVSAELHKSVEAADRKNKDAKCKKIPKYEFPSEIVTSAKLGLLASKGVSFAIKENEAVFIENIDSMKAFGKKLFGQAFLISEKAAAEKAAAEKAAAEKAIVWELSEREKSIVHSLGK
ncbi:MAG: hypothetical protein PUD63_12125 [Clostridia bacterium]|nr:hypothetical protein [Clostridia bacterium]